MTSPLPRTTTSGTRSGSPTSASAPAWPGVGTSCTAAAGTPFLSSAGASTSSTSARAEPSAADPVRSTAAERALSTCEATSTVTFGRASNTAPITPTGTRRSNTRSPVGSVRTGRCSGGSGVAASTSSWVGHVGQPLRGEPEPVEQAGGHAVALGGGDVGGVGREQLAGALAQQVGGGAQGGVDGRAPGRPDPRRGGGGADRGLADGLVIGGTRCSSAVASRRRALPARRRLTRPATAPRTPATVRPA